MICAQTRAEEYAAIVAHWSRGGQGKGFSPVDWVSIKEKWNMEKMMKLTTLCYIEQDGRYLMLHRVKKENDFNYDKWIGVGGKFEEGESPEECLLREVREETGLTLLEYRFRGIVTFVSDESETEYMHLFTADRFAGSLTGCSEGELVWVPKAEIKKLKIWEGDRIFFRLLEEEEGFFSLKLQYEKEKLAGAVTKTYNGAVTNL